jgi:hypothetical protein
MNLMRVIGENEMNERIQKLMEQAVEPNGTEGLGGSYLDLNPEKFAELIIMECANQVPLSSFMRICNHFGLK